MKNNHTYNAPEKLFIILLILVFNLFYIFAYGQNAVTTLCGTSTQGNPLWGPNGICIDPTGNELYVADYSAHRIKKVTLPGGIVTNFAGNGSMGYQDGASLAAEFSYPTGLKISSDGLYIYIADNGNCLIRKIDIANAAVSTIAGVYNAFSHGDNANGLLAQFNQPIDIVVAPGDSVLYISDSENHVIRKLNLITTAVTTVAGVPGSMGSTNGAVTIAKFRNPNGMCISADGTILYVVDAGNHKIRKIDLVNQMVYTLAGSGLPGNTDNASGTLASFNIPQGVSILPNDSILYCIDTYNHLVRAINVNTTSVTTIAGSSVTPQAHFADSPIGLQAKFYQPANCVLSVTANKLYISDQQNFRIRTMNTDIVLTSANNNNIKKYSVELFPNPASESVNLKINTLNNSQLCYTVFNTTGSLVFQAESKIYPAQQSINISLKNLDDGFYGIKVNYAGEIFFLKLLKVKQ